MDGLQTMTLNRRHKAILFITLVLTGCALLLGAELKEAIGFMMLGGAVAWAIGSDTGSKFYAGLKGVSGSFYSWVRLPLAMVLAGGILGAVLLCSRANPVLAVVFMCAAGIFMAPLTSIPTQKLLLRIPLILLAGVAFFAGLAGVISIDISTADRYAERYGELAVTGFMALLVGIFWLSKGWRLVAKSITAPSSAETAPSAGVTDRAWGQYISLSFGVITLALWLSLLAWSASSTWAYAPEKSAVPKGNNNLLVQVGFVVVLALWPYHSWRRIVGREPNTEPKNLRRHRRATTLVGMTFVIMLSLAVTYGIQNGNDQHMVERITAAGSDLTKVGTKIGAIKQRNLQTTYDYIQAYAEVETMLPEFESKIQQCAAVYAEARQMDESRGFINTQVFYKSHTPEMWKNNYEALDLVRQADSLTKQETLTIRNMASLPASLQPSYWQTEFKPLLVKEDELREKIQTLSAKTK